MSSPLILGLDAGTQSTRTALFGADGELIDLQREILDPAVEAPEADAAEQNPERYFDTLARATQRLAQRHPEDWKRIAGLALSCQRATVVCVDRDGQALRPAIVWLDRRRALHPPALPLALRALFAAAGAGAAVRHYRHNAEVNWLAEHEPRVLERAYKVLYLSGYLHHRLSGRFVDSDACQVGYLPFDFKYRRWAKTTDWRWRVLALRPEQLPDLVTSATRLGNLTREAARRFALPAGLPIVAGAADQAAALLAAGGHCADIPCISLGTTATVLWPLQRYRPLERWFPLYPAAGPGGWHAEYEVFRGLWLAGWFARELAPNPGADAIAELDREALAVAPGAAGLIALPTWSPGVPRPGAEARGAFVGLRESHRRAHLYRALIEGLGFELRGGLERICHRYRLRPPRIRLAGAGAQSPLVVQCLAGITGLAVERPRVAESAALGAAILAATGLGLYPDVAASARAMSRYRPAVVPEPTVHAHYERLYREVYRGLYATLAPRFARLATLAAEAPPKR